ncbi:hypothetical protein AAGR22_10690 [Erwinia sp. HDF1-3R]|uniref:hypothetical protein n=1 Tax=Erwinia sp. HDF1-3R TaxID=3141543 RepID=UPI0031F5C394
MSIISGPGFVTGFKALYSMARIQPKNTLSLLSRLSTVINSNVNLKKSQASCNKNQIQSGGRMSNLRPAPPPPTSILKATNLAIKLEQVNDKQKLAKLMMGQATQDHQKKPEAAREKWDLPSPGLSRKTVRAPQPPGMSSPRITDLAPQPSGTSGPTVNDLVMRLKQVNDKPKLARFLEQAMQDFQKSPEAARKKWGLTSPGLSRKTVRAPQPPEISSPRASDLAPQPPRTSSPTVNDLAIQLKQVNDKQNLARRLEQAMQDYQKSPEAARQKWNLSRSGSDGQLPR